MYGTFYKCEHCGKKGAYVLMYLLAGSASSARVMRCRYCKTTWETNKAIPPAQSTIKIEGCSGCPFSSLEFTKRFVFSWACFVGDLIPSVNKGKPREFKTATGSNLGQFPCTAPDWCFLRGRDLVLTLVPADI